MKFIKTLFLCMILLVPAAASAETEKVLIWDFARGGNNLNPDNNFFLMFAIADGLGVDHQDLEFMMVNELTADALAQVEYAFLWTAIAADERVSPLTVDEQAALAAWNANGGSIFIAEDFKGDVDTLLGAPFGIHVVGTVWGIHEVEFTGEETLLLDGPFGPLGGVFVDAMGVLDETSLLDGFEHLGWLVGGGEETALGVYDWGSISNESGLVALVTDSTFLAVTSWDVDYGKVISNFFYYAKEGPSDPPGCSGPLCINAVAAEVKPDKERCLLGDC